MEASRAAALTEARAYVKAYNEGVMSTHFVVVNKSHFNTLAKQEVIEERDGVWYKKSSNKPLYYAYKK